MTAPWFFFSYARDDHDAYLNRFYDDLVASVRVKVGGSLKDVAARDTRIEEGQPWPLELKQALQASRVFVALYSRSFFSSVWCGKELALFRLRQEQGVTPGTALPPLVMPLLWSREADLPSPLPQVVSDLQFAYGESSSFYKAEGLWQMMRLKAREDARLDIIEGFAQRLVDRAKAHPLPSLANPPDILTVRSAFEQGETGLGTALPHDDEVGPKYVQFVFVAGQRQEIQPTSAERAGLYGNAGADWKPYLPDVNEEVEKTAQRIVAEEPDLRYAAPIPIDSALMERLEDAKAANKVVVLIVDTWTLQLKHYFDFMRQYDNRTFPNAVVLVPWNPKEAAEGARRPKLVAALKKAFLNRLVINDPQFYQDAIKSPDDFRKYLRIAINEARMKLVNIGEIKKSIADAPPFAKPTL